MSMTRIMVTWLALAVLMTANGIFRELLLERWMPETAAGWVSVALGVAILLIGTRVGFRGIPADYPTASLLLVGAFLIALTVAFEFTIGMLVDKKSFAELAQAYAFWRGEPWPYVLMVLGLTPLMWRSSGSSR